MFFVLHSPQSQLIYADSPDEDKNFTSYISDESFLKSQLTPDNSMSKIGGNIDHEVISYRTQYTKHYKLKNGKMATIFSQKPIHYEDVNGKLQNISFKLVESNEILKLNTLISKQMYQQSNLIIPLQKNKEFFNAPYVPFGVNLPKNFIDGYTISKDNHSLVIKPIGARDIIGKLNNQNQIVYADPWIDTDVLLEVNDVGIKETIILKSGNAPSTFTFQLSEQLSNDLTLGELTIQPAWLVDAQGKYRDVKQSTHTKNGIHYLELEVDTTDLMYPIYVDPTVYAENLQTARLHVYDQTDPTPIHNRKIYYTATPDIGSELYFGGIEYMRTEYGLIKFELGDIFNIFNNSTVTHASLVNVDHWGLLNAPRMITQSWGDYLPTSLYGLTLEEIVQRWLTGEPNEGLLFSANGYPRTYDWSSAMLYVETDGVVRKPPTNLAITNKTANSITLQWSVDGPNNDEIFDFIIYNGDNFFGYTTDYSYTATDITFGQYSFSVKARYLDGNESVASNIVHYNYGKKRTYKYNQKNQLIEITYEGGYTQEFIYDANGNLLTIRDKND